MPVLGTGGRLILKRTKAAPCVINKADINTDTGLINTICSDYWSGDKVKICSSNDLPIFDDGSAEIDISVVATYFDDPQVLDLKENRDHITALNDVFYKTAAEEYPTGRGGDNADFYYRGGPGSDPPEPPVGGSACVTGYICVNELGQVKLYTDRCAGLACCGPTTLDFVPGAELMKWDSITIEHEDFDWEVLCGIQDYSIEFEAPNLETTSVGQKFGESVKSLVNGGGSCNFYVERACNAEGTDNSTELLQLLMMTEKGCEAEARFIVYQKDGDCSKPNCGELLPGTLYYESNILVTQTAINVRPTEMVAGSCNWVTTGTIKMLQAPNGGSWKLTSDDFNDGKAIANGFYYDQGGCPGSNNSPQLSWASGVTPDVATWRLRCIDKSANDFVHWSVDNIPAATTSIAQNGAWPAGVTINDTGWDTAVRANGWGGPCPPAGTGTHTYRITVDAMSASNEILRSVRLTFTAAP